MVDGVVDLGAFQFDLAYDKNILKYVSLTGGTSSLEPAAR